MNFPFRKKTEQTNMHVLYVQQKTQKHLCRVMRTLWVQIYVQG